MKINLSFLFTFNLVFIFCGSLFAQLDKIQKVDYYKVSEIRIFINDKSDILELRKQGLGFEHIKIQDTYFDALLDSFQIDILKKSGYPYEIIIDDVTKDYLERTRESREKIKLKKPSQSSGFGYGSMGGFYTLDEVVAQLDTMRAQYPNLITAKDSIGASIEGRTIWAVKISDNPEIKENESEVFYNSLTHAREPEGMMTVIYFMFYLLENYGTNPEVTYLVDNRELYFVPVINPDGYAYNQQISQNGGGMWRKNRRNNGSGIFGVDLNRNYGYMWGYNNIGSSPIPSNLEYRGTGSFSEPETQAVRDFCNSQNFIICNNYHSYWNVVFAPWDYNLKLSPDSTTFNNIINLGTMINGYKNGRFIPDNYELNGGVVDWMYGEQTTKPKIFAYATEVGNDNDGFWPIPERIFPLADENVYLNKVLAWGPGIIEDPPYIKSVSEINIKYVHSLDDSLKLNAIETNPDNHTSNVYAQILTAADSLIDEVQLDKLDSSYTGIYGLKSLNENFYKVRFKQSGIDIPSNLYFFDKDKLKFTTAGPVIVDSLWAAYIPAQKRLTFRLYLKNQGNTLQINSSSVNILCEDPWVTSISGNRATFSTIQPGQLVLSFGFTSIFYDSTSFPGYFNLKFEIASGGYVYWTDTLKYYVPVTGIEEEEFLPQEYSLSQNFPNPFNPSTKISWQLPVGSKATLKVFDILGKELATLVNEYKPAGKYETEFIAEAFPSGVYFYQLRAGDYVNTKKMILLK